MAESSDVRWDLQRNPGRVDFRLRGNDKKARHPGRRPGIHLLAVLSDVRWDLQRAPGRVDFRLRGNDKKARHPRRRPGIHLLAVLSDVRVGLRCDSYFSVFYRLSVRPQTESLIFTELTPVKGPQLPACSHIAECGQVQQGTGLIAQ